MVRTQQPVWSCDPVEGGTVATTSRVKVVYEGETVDADDMGFKAITEAPLSYQVEDGTVIEIKHEVKKVFRLCDKKKEDGSPIYLVNGIAQVRTEAPPVPNKEEQGS